MDTLPRDLLQEIECPVCMDVMIPPITQCENGHNICKSCASKLVMCPTCRHQIIFKIRNLALENLTTKVEFPCTYQENGCVEKNYSINILEHKSSCQYGPTDCPVFIARREKCSWKGNRGDLKSHILSDHKTTAFMSTRKDIFTITGFSPATKYCEHVLAYNDVFHRVIEVKDNNWHCTLFYVGCKQESSKFKYRISFWDESKDTHISFTKAVRCLGEDVDEIYKQCKCVKLPYDVVNHFVDDSGYLKFEMEIFENKRSENLTSNS